MRFLTATAVTVTAAAAVAVALASCSSGEPDQPAAQVPATVITTPATTPPPTPSVATPATVPLGRDITRESAETGSTARVAALEYRHNTGRAAEPPGQRGFVHAALEVRYCLDAASDPAVVSNGSWVLVSADGRRFEPASTVYDDAQPAPLYPVEGDVVPGRCVRGWAPFDVPAGEWPVEVQYAPAGSELPPGLWSIGR